MLILAHRGASGYAPENTWPAFKLAREMGANGIETDVQLSKDGVPVLVHDTNLDRTSDGTGPVADLTWDELARLDAGSWLDARFAGERIVRLDEFLDWCFPDPLLAGDLMICLEVKAPAAADPLIAMLNERALTGQRVAPGDLVRLGRGGAGARGAAGAGGRLPDAALRQCRDRTGAGGWLAADLPARRPADA